MCASHNSEERHVKLARQMMSKIAGVGAVTADYLGDSGRCEIEVTRVFPFRRVR
jgi:L-asparaginase II